MRTSIKLWLLLVVVVLLPVSLLAYRAHVRASALESLPPVILWAWERPEQLNFINPHEVGVAFLAKTINLRGDETLAKPRLQPLELAAGTKLVAVVRIETDAPALSPAQLEKTTNEILNAAKLPAVSVVQIDFDATVSERDFYRALLDRVRRQLPKATALSMTALASWCAGDDWLAGLPVDEAVPMLFRLGVDQRQFQRRLESGQPFASPRCRNAAGVSTDEPVKAPPVDRLYLFSPTPWTEASLTNALEAYQE